MSKLSIPLPANLPENWTYGQIIAPTGQEVDLPANYGYNYLMNQVNNAQKAALELDSKKAELDMSNLDSPSAALYNLGAGVRPNLADNWDFTNPVNQRGKTQYTQGQYAMDRWVVETGSSVTIKDGYIAIATQTQAIIQHITEAEAKQLNGKTVTVSILTKEGNLATKTGVITYDGTKDIHLGTGSVDGVKFGVSLFPKNKSFQIGRIFGTGNVKAVKTEFGDTQTLAYQTSDGKWELLEHADHVAERLKCQQYFWKDNTYQTSSMTSFAGRGLGAGTEISFTIPTSSKMLTPITMSWESFAVCQSSGVIYNSDESEESPSIVSIISGETNVYVRMRLPASSHVELDVPAIIVTRGFSLTGG